MRPYTYDISFRIFHPTLDPDLIIKKLEMNPKYKWKVGTQRKTPKGKPLKGVYNESYCSFELKDTQNVGLVEFLKKNNELLYTHKSFFNKLTFTGGDIEYFIGLYADSNFGEVFDIELLKQLADLNIKLSLDFYVNTKRKC